MKNLKELSDCNKPVLMDGGWTTTLQENGLSMGKAPELWNIENPEAVYKTASDFINAGVEIIGTNSFGANLYNTNLKEDENSVYMLNYKAAEISKTASKAKIPVCGYIGPAGLFAGKEKSKPDIIKLQHSYEIQIEGLKEGGADFIMFETFSLLDESELAVSIARKYGFKNILLSFSYLKKDNKYYTLSGIRPEESARFADEIHVDVLGVNCGNGFNEAIEITEIYKTETKRPLLLKPNSGSGKNSLWKNFSTNKVNDLLTNGILYIGGCCGVSPFDIRKMNEKILKFSNTRPKNN